MTGNCLYQKIYRVVAMIPFGMVATYGQVAKKVGIGNNARVIGYALNRLPADSSIPWHRVVNYQGKISLRESADLQQLLLEQEGVRFSLEGKINRENFCWRE